MRRECCKSAETCPVGGREADGGWENGATQGLKSAMQTYHCSTHPRLEVTARDRARCFHSEREPRDKENEEGSARRRISGWLGWD